MNVRVDYDGRARRPGTRRRMKLKMMRRVLITLALSGMLLLLFGCGDDLGLNTDETWLIPVDQVYGGGPGRDGIPALSNPQLFPAGQISYLSDHDLVVGVKINGVARAYSHKVLDWHEVINDGIGTVPFTITYCPLTGSAIGWNRKVNGNVTSFGVSGLLYNSNLIPYDRATGSNWSQMGLKCVNGTLAGRDPETIPVLETTWRTWKSMFPESKVVSTNTGYSRPYGEYPYEDYRTNNNRLLYPVNNTDNRLTQKERVLGVVVGDVAKAYRMKAMPFDIRVTNEQVGDEPLVIVGSQGKNFAMAFKRTAADGIVLNFSSVQNSLPVVMVNDDGTKWDIFGRGISGPRAGEGLRQAQSFIAYWFAWSAFYPDTEL